MTFLGCRICIYIYACKEDAVRCIDDIYGRNLNGKSLSNIVSQIGLMFGVMSCSLYLMWTVSMKVCPGSCIVLTCRHYIFHGNY